jgi:malate synthase
MEDLATDRIYRLMIAQRMKHSSKTFVVDESGKAVDHTPQLITRLFDEEVEKIIANPARADIGTPDTFREARRISEAMITQSEINPV